MNKYDPASTLIYAIGRAIETEDDDLVREQLEDLEDRLTVNADTIRGLKVLELEEVL